MSFWSVVFSYSTQQQRATSWSDCDIRRQVDCKRQLVTTSQLGGWTEQTLQSTSQGQTCSKKRSRSLFGGLLPIWATWAFWIPAKPLHLRSMPSKLMKTTMPAASMGQQKGSNSSPQQHLTTLGTTNASEVEQVGLWTFASSTIFTWPLANQLPPDKHLDSCLQGKCFHNQQDAENAFQEFVESWSTDFYAIVINLFLVGKNVLIIMVLILINKGVFELSYDDLKFMLQTLNYVCTNLMYSIFFPMYPIQIYSLFLEYATCFYTFPPVCSAENSFLQVSLTPTLSPLSTPSNVLIPLILSSHYSAFCLCRFF